MQAPKGKISKTTGFGSKADSHPEEGDRLNPQDPTGFDEDMDTIESMDFEKLTDTIRDNCRTRIKELDLGHLIKP